MISVVSFAWFCGPTIIYETTGKDVTKVLRGDSDSESSHSDSYINKSDGKVGDNDNDGDVDEEDREIEFENYLNDKMNN